MDVGTASTHWIEARYIWLDSTEVEISGMEKIDTIPYVLCQTITLWTSDGHTQWPLIFSYSNTVFIEVKHPDPMEWPREVSEVAVTYPPLCKPFYWLV